MKLRLLFSLSHYQVYLEEVKFTLKKHKPLPMKLSKTTFSTNNTTPIKWAD